MEKIKNILQEIIDLEGSAMDFFFTNNPECFDKSKPDWLYPRLVAFFQSRPHNDKIDELLNEMSIELSAVIGDNIFSELTIIDKSKSIDDAFVEAFILKLTKNESKEYKFQQLKSPYKTKGYSLALKSVDKWVLQNLTMEFGETEHPYILAELTNCYMLSSSFLDAFQYLYRAAKQLTTYPHKYWNSEYGMMGAANVYRHLFILVTDVEMKLRIFKLYYLHLTRLINITKDKLILSNSYSNRAFMCRDSLSLYALPFIGINPDLLYISDLWYAHNCGQPEVPAVMTMDFYKMSLTMYQNASIYVNNTGGYKEIEDRTYGEIVEAKNFQSIEIAIEYLKQFKDSNCSINRKELNKIFQDFEKECRFDFVKFKNRVLKFKN
ncbi:MULTISPECIES: hypothetical protein [unclassified Carboxylicivirga]|uniref:hypothetical protein n=1 Tax=Carboxylicivirga TaxID=1628153 RepID=UPI003D32FA05